VIALFHVDGRFYALDGICPHAGGPLGEGTLCGGIVTCPWHGWQFDVTTGRHASNARLQHAAFGVKVEGNDVYVEIP
jgi:nitrite reductase/ring-hydroxylating ferredoxin subunit